MKDFIVFLVLLVLGAGIVFAVPTFGIVIGAGLGIWFLWEAFKEHKDAQKGP